MPTSYPMDIAFSPDGRYLALICHYNVSLVDLSRRFGGEAPVFPAELPELWDDLQSSDVRRAYQAYWRMVIAGPMTVRFLGDRLKPVREAPPDTLARLIKELGHGNYAVRHQAMQDLERLGEATGPALRVAMKNNSPLEMRRRIESLLAKHHDARQIQAISMLEAIGTSPARSILEMLGNGMPKANLTRNAKASLDRLNSRDSLP